MLSCGRLLPTVLSVAELIVVLGAVLYGLWEAVGHVLFCADGEVGAVDTPCAGWVCIGISLRISVCADSPARFPRLKPDPWCIGILACRFGSWILLYGKGLSITERPALGRKIKAHDSDFRKEWFRHRPPIRWSSTLTLTGKDTEKGDDKIHHLERR
jgi:hypothetical protein